MTKIYLVPSEREKRLIPNGIPKWIRCYDNGGETVDRYTVVFTKLNGYFPYIGMSEHPTWPNGFGQHGGSSNPIDKPRYSHLGKKITFAQLPQDCREVVISDYREYWNL